MRVSNVESLPAEPASPPAPVRTVVVLNSLGFYGLERNVIETFDRLRPFVEPVMLIPQAAERYRTDLFAELTRRGFALEFFSDTHDWPRITKPRSLRGAFRIAAALLRANRDLWKTARHADCIYIPILTGLYFAFFTSAWLRFRRRKVLYTFQDLVWEPMRALRFGSFWVSDFVHLTRRSLEMAVSSNPYLAHKRNHVIAPVIDLADRVSGDRLEVADSGRIILFVGQVARHKGIELLLEAFRRIAPLFPDVSLHIAGGPGMEYGPNFPQVLEATGVKDRIRHWGFVKDVEPLLRASYVYVHPSLPSIFHESFGRSTVEAMAAGVPIVCFRSGALAEIVEHEITGLIGEEESAACLADLLTQLLSEPARRDAYSRNCLRRYQERYSTEQVRREWRALLSPSPR